MDPTGGLVGAKISLTSKSDIRYRGTLHSINAQDSTISLENVTSMGTEDRRPADQRIPGTDTVYEFVVFRAADVKDLGIEQQAPPPKPQAMLPHDPAIMSVGAGGGLPAGPSGPAPPEAAPSASPPPSGPFPHQSSQPAPPPQSSAPPPPVVRPPPVQQNLPPRPQAAPVPSAPRQSSQNGAGGAISAMQRVEQAMGELSAGGRNASAGPSRPRNGQSGGGVPFGGRQPGPLSSNAPPVPQEDYQFEEMNKKFEELKRELGKGKQGEEDGQDSGDEKIVKQDATSPSGMAYNKQKSFFDSVSSANTANPGGLGAGGRGGGQRGRGMGLGAQRRRQDEATFGDAGPQNQRGPRRGGRGRAPQQGGQRQPGQQQQQT